MRNTPLEPFNVNINDEGIAVGLDPWERRRELVWKRRRFAPTPVDRHWLEWQAECKLRLDLCISCVDFSVVKAVYQRRPTIFRFRMVEVTVTDAPVSGLVDGSSRLRQQ